jgi:hypothetical protein
MLVAFGGSRGFCAIEGVAVVLMAWVGNKVRGLECALFRNTAGAALCESSSDA